MYLCGATCFAICTCSVAEHINFMNFFHRMYWNLIHYTSWTGLLPIFMFHSKMKFWTYHFLKQGGTCQVHKVNKFRCHTRSSHPYRITLLAVYLLPSISASWSSWVVSTASILSRELCREGLRFMGDLGMGNGTVSEITVWVPGDMSKFPSKWRSRIACISKQYNVMTYCIYFTHSSPASLSL